MKQRATDSSDRITRDEAKAARVPWWKAFKLFIVNLPTIAKVVMLIIGLWGGTMAAPEVLNQLAELTKEEEPPLPIPIGVTVVPKAPAINPEVRQSLHSMNAAINQHTAALKALKKDMTALEKRRKVDSDSDDSALDARVMHLEEFHD